MSLSDLIGDANTVLYGDYYANLRLRNVPKSVLPSVLTTTIVESDCYVLESIGQLNQNEKPKFIFLEDESLIPQISSFDQSTFIKPSPVDPTSSHYEAYRKLTRFNSSNDSLDPLLYPEHSFRITNPSKDDVLAYGNKLNSSSPLLVNSILSDEEDNNDDGLQEEPKSVEGEAKPLKLKRNRRKLEESLPKPRSRKDISNDNGLKALYEQPKLVKEKSKPLKPNSKKRILKEFSPNTRKVGGENCRYKLRCLLVGCEFKFDNNARLMAHLRTKHSVEEVLNVNRVTNEENNPSMKNIVLNCQKAQSEETTNQSQNKANRKPLTNNMLNISGHIQKSLNVPLQSVDMLVTKVDHQPPKLINRKTLRSETPQTQPQEKRFGRPKKVQKYKSY